VIGLVVMLAAALPPDWFPLGDQPEAYEAGPLEGRGPGGKPALYVHSTGPGGYGHFGGVGQFGPVARLRGRRVRLTAWARTQDVEEWAGVWLRVEKNDAKHTLQAYDNEHDRPMRGTRAWAQHELVVDVPKDAGRLVFGVFLRGPGMVAVSDFRLAPVSLDVPLTGSWGKPNDEPAGLDLEAPAEATP
jgi:hypothetical protein